MRIDIDMLGVPAFSVAVASDGQLVYDNVNAANTALTGLTKARMIGNSPTVFASPEAAETIASHYRRCIETMQSVEYEIELDLLPERRWWRTSLSPVIDDEGKAVQIIGLPVNISEQKRAEEADRDAARQDASAGTSPHRRFENPGATSGDVAQPFPRVMPDAGLLGNVNICQGRPDGGDGLHEVRQALEQNQFVPFFQPIVDLRTGEVRGLEALARWHHPDRGIVPPSEFAAALTDPVLSVAIDDAILRQSLHQMRRWVSEGVAVGAVNVNASEAQLLRPDLVQHIADLLRLNQLPAERLKVELVETAFLSRDPEQITATVDGLARLGVVAALDDFGTGHASLTHLRQFKIDRVKIDRSFVSGICTNPFDRGLVKGLVDLGKNLGIRMTAEGVETPEQLALLRKFGCDCAQGYLIGRPTPAAGVPAMVERWYESQYMPERARMQPRRHSRR